MDQENLIAGTVVETPLNAGGQEGSNTVSSIAADFGSTGSNGLNTISGVTAQFGVARTSASDGSQNATTQESSAPKTYSNALDSMVAHWYRGLLGGEPDAAGLNFWTNWVKKIGCFPTALEFFKNANVQTVVSPLSSKDLADRMYRAYMQRDADASGLAFWNAHLSNGAQRYHIAREFLSSDEFANVCKKAGAQFHVQIENWYQKLFLRALDPSGLKFWPKEMDKFGCHRTSVTFVTSSDTQNALKSVSNREYMIRHYRAFLNREPDTVGLNFWTGKLDDGESRISLSKGFLEVDAVKTLCP